MEELDRRIGAMCPTTPVTPPSSATTSPAPSRSHTHMTGVQHSQPDVHDVAKRAGSRCTHPRTRRQCQPSHDDGANASSQLDHFSILNVQGLKPWTVPSKVPTGNTDEELTEPEQEGLKRLVENMVNKVKKIFSVVPVQGNLLLKRAFDGCRGVWQEGPNIGKCAHVKRVYDKEMCIDDFQIPDKHLSGVYLWNATHPEPSKVLIEDGEGLSDTDYVLYVRSRTTVMCINAGYNVIAYAAYCQVDQHHRPIAGLINFCPELLRDDKKEIDEVTALHEMFHALGFSNHLFEKFQECLPSGPNNVTCTPRHHPVRTIGGVPRLVTPRLVEVTSRHFNCTTHDTINEFGPILQTQDGKYKSHWDPAFMQTSLMTPTIGLPHLTFIDEITLSLFEDSGWYKVNFDYAEEFLWGKGGGCDFGTSPACEKDSSFFCTSKARQCHYLHKDKATCKTNIFLHGCRIFQAKDIQDSCRYPPTDGSSSVLDSEYYGEDGRCFVANVTKVTAGTETSSTQMTGRCYQHRCNNSDLVLVRVSHSPWLVCPHGELIQVPGYDGVLQCPDATVVCGESTRGQSTRTSAPMAMTETSSYEPTLPAPSTQNSDTTGTERRRVCIEVTFSTADNPVLDADDTVTFHGALVDAVIRLSSVTHNRLHDAHVVNSGSIIYYIEVKPPYNATDGPTCTEVINRLESAVHSHKFTVSLEPDGNTYVASSVSHTFGKCKVTSHRKHTSIIVGAALGSVVTIAVIGVLVGLLIVLLRRRYIAQKMAGNQSISDSHENKL
ncbi:hypothetical protein LSAT2_018867 [Lamellibrachia satsuma]|nr:hypothetical protein LSAT2_018867 [Lamellibrachia satsuma]